MKYLVFLSVLVFLSACSLTAQQTEPSPVIVTSLPCNALEAADTDRLADTDHDPENCERAQEGVVELIHPADPIEVPLPEFVQAIASEPDDIWVYIANNLSLKIPLNQPRLDAQKKWYLKHPTYMRRVATRARPFLYYIVQQLELNDIPLDIALLPIVESGFDPFAYSSGRAAGMWQFIPESGKRFGMSQNWWHDGRRDVIASTQGAIDYLKYLHNMFDGNWLHALAAYNSGEGRVQRSIRKNKRLGKPTDFWSLDLPRETRAYVPKLLALADMLRYQDKYNFKWPSINNAPVIEVVDLGSQIDLAMAAQFAELTLPELQALNPGFNKWATDPNGPHRLVLPIDKAATFKLALAQTPEEERLNWERHKVKSGDSIGKIAQMYNTNIDVIKRINNIKGNTIYAGDNLLVPVALTDLNAYALNTAQNSYHPGRNNQGKTKLTYTVQSGDSLWDISRAYDVSITQLSRWNRMSRNDTLSIGKVLIIWSDSDQSKANTTKSLTYRVRTGDSLSEIASKFNVRVDDIVRWNALRKNKFLQPGQQLKLLIDVTKS
ncbi:LysM peptidoglycan-binding domain-containing protein [Glaciecola sp. SC05]|uniref:LysM peptidoglycan-binding domain-containing protein n=1 Tax=Glaciecola sp. SC05 TaxID=1987355 RepID=UPI003527BE0A